MSWRSLLHTVTPTGWYVVGVTAISAVLGGLWGWIEAWSLAIIGVAILLIALPFLFGARAYRIRIEPSLGSIVAGGELRASVEVTNTAARPQLPSIAELVVTAETSEEDHARDGLLEISIPLLGPHESVTLPVRLAASDRGVLRLGPITVTRRDPLGLLRRELSWHERHLVHVHPRTTPLPPHSAGLVRDLEGRASTRLTDADLSFHAVRDYVPGDAVRHVHWKATAKAGSLMVRQYEETQAARLAVLFDARADEYATRAEFELGVSVAASLSLHAARNGREHVVAASRAGSGGRIVELPTHNPTRLLDAWAELTTAVHGPRLASLAGSLAGTGRQWSIVVLVTGSVPGLDRIRRAAIAFPPDVRVLAVRCEEFGDPRAQRIDPLTLCTVGALEDVPGLMLRGAL